MPNSRKVILSAYQRQTLTRIQALAETGSYLAIRAGKNAVAKHGEGGPFTQYFDALAMQLQGVQDDIRAALEDGVIRYE